METIKQIPMLYAFVKVAQKSSFSKASEELGVSKSHLSKLVKDLELSLKQSLFVRTTRTIEFTEFGKFLFDSCCDSISDLERMAQQLGKISQIPKGQIRITVAGAYGEESVSPMISQLLARYPSISTEIVFSEKVLNLEKSKIDLAIRVSSKKPTDGHTYKIGERREHLCASESFLRQNGIPKSPSDLKKMNCLVGSNDVWSLKRKGRSYKVKVKGNFKSANGRSLTQAAISGLGVANLPEVYVKKYLEEKKLISILQDFTETPVPIWAVTPFKKEIPLIVRLAIEELTLQF
tara:strand:- start:86719 stop:87594 length:876 start_codon:yes stop_codon:yes gene_type:complete